MSFLLDRNPQCNILCPSVCLSLSNSIYRFFHLFRIRGRFSMTFIQLLIVSFPTTVLEGHKSGLVHAIMKPTILYRRLNPSANRQVSLQSRANDKWRQLRGGLVICVWWRFLCRWILQLVKVKYSSGRVYRVALGSYFRQCRSKPHLSTSLHAAGACSVLK